MKRKPKPKKKESPRVLTIGHSTRSIDDFIGLLRVHGGEHVVDIRTVPKSRHNPQFNQDALPVSLKEAGIRYSHLPGLGGLRRTHADSINVGWRNLSFRGYADYMQTPEFTQSLMELVALASQAQVVLMCAEAVPWRCHRSLVADALLVRGIVAEHIMSDTKRQVHKLTPFAKVRGTKITYPEEASEAVEPKSAPKRTERKPKGIQRAGD